MATDRITLHGLTGVGKVELELQKDQRAYVFIGSNGVGKTKCLEALFITDILSYEQSEVEYINPQDLIFKSFEKNNQLVISKEKFNTTKHSPIIRIQDAFQSKIDRNSRPPIYVGANSRSVILENKNLGLLGDFNKRYANHLNATFRAITDQKMANLGMQSNIQEWFILRAQSANPFQKNTDNRRIEIDTLLNLLHQVDERVDSKFLELDGSNNVAIKISGVITRLEHLSSGFTSLLKILQTIVSNFSNYTNEVNLAYVPGLVYIDEIESHLHVSWQAHLIPLLKKLFPNTTFYVATHSPIVLSQLQEGEAYLLKRDEDGVVRSNPIKSPNKRLISDVLNESLGVNLNALKVKNADPAAQTDAKKLLLELLSEGERP